MSFDFGGPRLHSIGLAEVLALAGFLLTAFQFFVNTWPKIAPFVRRNGRVMIALTVTFMTAFVAAPFLWGFMVLVSGAVQMHNAITGVFGTGAVCFTVCSFYRKSYTPRMAKNTAANANRVRRMNKPKELSNYS